MPLMKGHSKEVVGQNIKEMVKSGYKPKQAIAASLASARKFKKMAMGGMVQDEDKGGMEDMMPMVEKDMGQSMPSADMEDMAHMKGMPSGGLAKNESMAEMDRADPEDQKRSLNEIREDGEYYPAEVANPNEMEEAQGFAKALRRQAMGVMSPENYAMGGLVQDGPEEDERLNGNRPEYIINDGTAEPMSSMPSKPDGLEHKIMGDPSGPELSVEALEAIRMKRKSRRYGVYDPKI